MSCIILVKRDNEGADMEGHEMDDYYFIYENADGEMDFYIRCESREVAWEIAHKYFPTGADTGILFMSEKMPEGLIVPRLESR